MIGAPVGIVETLRNFSHTFLYTLNIVMPVHTQNTHMAARAYICLLNELQ